LKISYYFYGILFLKKIKNYEFKINWRKYKLFKKCVNNIIKQMNNMYIKNKNNLVLNKIISME
jgi:hypothetical protein